MARDGETRGYPSGMGLTSVIANLLFHSGWSIRHCYVGSRRGKVTSGREHPAGPALRGEPVHLWAVVAVASPRSSALVTRISVTPGSGTQRPPSGPHDPDLAEGPAGDVLLQDQDLGWLVSRRGSPGRAGGVVRGRRRCRSRRSCPA